MSDNMITTSILGQIAARHKVSRIAQTSFPIQIEIYRETLNDLETFLDTSDLRQLTSRSLSIIRDDILEIIKGVRDLSVKMPSGYVGSIDGILEELRQARDAVQTALGMFELSGKINESKSSKFFSELRICQKNITKANLLFESPPKKLAQSSSEIEKKSKEPNLKQRDKPPENEPPIKEPPKKRGKDSSDDVTFTAFYPKEGKIDTWYTLLVYAHLISAIHDVYRDAGRFQDELPAPQKTTLDSLTRITRGTKITVIPSCDGIVFNPPDTYITWQEEYHRLDFRFCADNSLFNKAANGRITILVGPLIIGTLDFAMHFSDKNDSTSVIQEERASMYHQDKIFISYSHKDTDLVLAFKKVHEATGFDVLIDIDDLRSGQEWNTELMRMIDRADIFQLFWSENSKKSKYCKQEWKHALSRATKGFIRPVYWHKPIPNPPKELSKYHFEYVDLQK